MDQTHGETLSAFFDGEQVDPEMLVESLGEPGATEMLAEFAAMRAQVLGDDSRPRPGFHERVSAVLKEPLLRRVLSDRRFRRALAASLLIGVGIGSFLLGSDSARERLTFGGPTTGTPAVATQDRARPETQVARSTPSGPNDAARQRPGTQLDPPVASLRLRFGQWRDTSAPGRVEEGARR